MMPRHSMRHAFVLLPHLPRMFLPCPTRPSLVELITRCSSAGDSEQCVSMREWAVLVLWQDSTVGQSLQRINR